MNWKKFLPDSIVLASFFAFTFFLFSPLFSGQKLVQGDIIQFKGMASEYEAYLEKGEKIHWTNSAFSGMPTYLVASGVFKDSNLSQNINSWLRTIFPDPSGIFFLCLLSFFILSRALKTSKYLGAIGAVMFVLGTFVLDSIGAGHNTKILAYAFSPLILAALVYAFRKKYILGATIMALGLGGQLAANHIQITYYTLIVCLFYGAYLLLKTLREKDSKHFLKAAGAILAGILIAVGINYNNLATTLEHSKETNRGGQSELTATNNGENNVQQKGSGLDYDYSTQWSFKPIETFSLVIPRFMGGSSGEKLGETSHLYKSGKFKKSDVEYVPTYWGEMPFTGAPIYIGALTFFLFVFCFFVLKGPLKWWMLGLSVLIILISWGRFSPGIYDFMFNNAPFFNKFRVPSMILLMLGLIFPMMGILSIDQLLKTDHKETYLKPLFTTLGITGGMLVLFGLVGSSMYSFSSSQELAGQMDRSILDLLIKDRKMLMTQDTIRSLIFVLAAGGLLYLFLKEKMKTWHILASLAILTLADLGSFGHRYFNNDKFEFNSDYEKRTRLNNADKQILQDQDIHYRVFNVSGGAFQDAKTSFHHKSIGGYHAAKLKRYQDLIARQLSTGNEAALDMLNTKYLIGQTQNGQMASQQRPTALGNAWLVDSLHFANTADEEMVALSNLDLNSNVVLRSSEKGNLKESYNGQGSISLVKYHPEVMTYETNILGDNPGYAVFSEIYYAPKKGDGWQAFMDGKPVHHQKVNYTLRGLEIPVGKHEVIFKYTKNKFKQRAGISKLFSALLLLLIVGSIVKKFLDHSKKAVTSNV